MEERKHEEVEFHNLLRNLKEGTEEHKRLTSNRKYYSVARQSDAYVEDWLRSHCRPGTRVLEYGCGEGSFSFFLAGLGAHVTGIDIGDVGIRKATKLAAERGLAENTKFLVMDAEATTFPDSSFDIICTAGVLHHLDRTKAFPEMARILKPDGAAIAGEPLAHNPFIQLYRKLTPHLRTKFETEHILHARKDTALAKKYFRKVDVRFFHLASLLAVPFRTMPFFDHLLSALEKVDGVLLSIPYIRRHAWTMVFIMSEPRK